MKHNFNTNKLTLITGLAVLIWIVVSLDASAQVVWEFDSKSTDNGLVQLQFTANTPVSAKFVFESSKDYERIGELKEVFATGKPPVFIQMIKVKVLSSVVKGSIRFSTLDDVSQQQELIQFNMAVNPDPSSIHYQKDTAIEAAATQKEIPYSSWLMHTITLIGGIFIGFILSHRIHRLQSRKRTTAY